MKIENKELLDFINRNRVSIDEWAEVRIYSHNNGVINVQLKQNVIGLDRFKSLVIKENEYISWKREQKLNQLLG